MADLEDRVTELEVRLAFVDDTVNELSSADAEIARRLGVSLATPAVPYGPPI